MSSVQVFHCDQLGTELLVGVYDGDRVKAHSATIRDLIATRPEGVIHQVTLRGPTLEGLKTVLDKIQAIQKGEILRITVSTRDLGKAIQIHRSIDCLKVEPSQDHVTGHLTGYVSHQIVNPDEMEAVQLEFGDWDHPHHRIWMTMINTIAYKWVKGDIPEPLANLLKATTLRYPVLDAALNSKVNDLLRVRKARQIQAEKKAAKKARNEAKAL